MLHGDDAPTSIEVVDIAHCHAGEPRQQVAARPRRRRPPRHIGYARVTGSQTHLHNAVHALLDAGVQAADVHTDYGPLARTRDREGLQQALQQTDSGDTLIVASLVTFARTQGELSRLLAILRWRQIALQIGHQSLTDIPPPELVAMGTEVTDQLLIDIQDMRAAARAAQQGRGSMPWTLSPRQAVEVIEAFDAGQPRRQIAAKYGISLSTVFRVASG